MIRNTWATLGCRSTDLAVAKKVSKARRFSKPLTNTRPYPTHSPRFPAHVLQQVLLHQHLMIARQHQKLLLNSFQRGNFVPQAFRRRRCSSKHPSARRSPSSKASPTTPYHPVRRPPSSKASPTSSYSPYGSKSPASSIADCPAPQNTNDFLMGLKDSQVTSVDLNLASPSGGSEDVTSLLSSDSFCEYGTMDTDASSPNDLVPPKNL